MRNNTKNLTKTNLTNEAHFSLPHRLNNPTDNLFESSSVGFFNPRGTLFFESFAGLRHEFLVSIVGCLVKSVLYFALILAFGGAFPAVLHAQGKGRAKVAEGNKLFAEGKFDEANNAYRDAQIDNPTSPIIDYNIANTLYEKSNYEEAIKLYDKISKNTDDPILQTKAYFNLGNTLYRLNKLPESILAYKEALKINPNDEDAKYNLEYVRAKLKQNADKQEQGQDKQQNTKQEKIDPSEYAKKLRARAEAFVARKEYAQAYELMMEGLQKDETVAAYQDFIDRIKDVVAIDVQ